MKGDPPGRIHGKSDALEVSESHDEADDMPGMDSADSTDTDGTEVSLVQPAADG